ncbi:unnamed protein product [Oikopleura dioica]|uniref:Uncharacterized protein n=1 Tax=Oikopleura dioica TaxID=34765 RepID=E4Z0Z0_OIKDI|nr:unnamed protein product [Oikopleura dioica]
MTIFTKSLNKLSEIFRDKKSKEKIDPSRFECQARRAKKITPRESPSVIFTGLDSHMQSRRNVCQRDVDVEYLL